MSDLDIPRTHDGAAGATPRRRSPPTSTTRCWRWPTCSTPPATRCAPAPASAPRSSPTTTSPTPASCPRRPARRPRRTSAPPPPASSGLLTRSVELDADALVVRATVLTYRWIDELQEAAYKTLGSIAGRAIGYLAPEVALGGAIVCAGLIETDALDRDGVTAYLNELAENNPELMDHCPVAAACSTGSRCARCSPPACSPPTRAPHAARGGLRAIGVRPVRRPTPCRPCATPRLASSRPRSPRPTVDSQRRHGSRARSRS